MMEETMQTFNVTYEAEEPDESNIIDLRDRGICEECQIKVIEAIMGKKYELT